MNNQDYRNMRNGNDLRQWLSQCEYSKALLQCDNLVIGYADTHEELEECDYEFWFQKEHTDNFYEFVGVAQRYATLFEEC